MKHKSLLAAVVVFALACQWQVALAELTKKDAARLDKALSAIADYDYRLKSESFVVITDLVTAAANRPDMRSDVERHLIKALKSDATPACKDFICRQLYVIGSAECVPALAQLLTDEKLSHMARYALEAIPDRSVDDALRSALARTKGQLKVGVISSIGNRRDGEAITALGELLQAEDRMVAISSAEALGKIGDKAAADLLRAARKTAGPELLPAVTDACLVCADGLVESGQPELATSIYQEVFDTAKLERLRVAAFCGLAEAGGQKGPEMLVGALKGQDAGLRRAAVRLASKLPGQETTMALAQCLPELDAGVQVMLLGALADRSDRAALQAVMAAAGSDNAQVRVAALKALGKLGDESTVVLLAEAAASMPAAECGAARHSLASLADAAADAEILARMATAKSKVCVELIRASVARRNSDAVPVLLGLAEKGDESVRPAAIDAMAVLASPKEMPALAQMLLAEHAAEKPKAYIVRALEGAVREVARSIENVDERADAIARLIPWNDSSQQKLSLLRSIGDTKCDRTLALVRKGMKDKDAAVVDAAVRILVDWPDASPAQDVLDVARNSTEEKHRVLALRGYVRMAGTLADSDPVRSASMFVRAMEMAQRPEDKKLVLSGIKTANSVEALKAVQACLGDAAVAAEAEQTVLSLAGALVGREKNEARSALTLLAGSTGNAETKTRAKELIGEIDKYHEYVTRWECCGPYARKGRDVPALLEVVFPPEDPDAKDVRWKPLTKGAGHWMIDLKEAVGPHEKCAGYARTTVWSPAEQDARLELGSDDGVMVWFNGEVVHAFAAPRSTVIDQDKVEVHLKKGWNALMLKVTQGSGGWAFCLCIRKPDGTELEGLRVRAQPQDGMKFVLYRQQAFPLELVGDWEGKVVLEDGDEIKLVAQLIGLGMGACQVKVLPEFDKRVETLAVLNGRASGPTARLSGAGAAGRFKDTRWKVRVEKDVLTGSVDGAIKGSVEMKKAQRLSPTLGAKPPEGAVVLLDGTNLDEWRHTSGKPCPWLLLPDGAMQAVPGTGSVITKRQFADQRLHLEFRTPYMPKHSGQGRANSGVYLQGRYEVQILDSYGLYGHHNECGGIYSIKDPDANMCAPPMQWQTYDVTFKSARFDKDGKLISHARMTVLHNGVKIHDEVEVKKATTASHYKDLKSRGGLYLQDHGNPVQFRNIWVVETE